MLAASNLARPFDVFETYALILTVGPAQLLDPARDSQIPAYAGSVIALTLFGWGVGGTVGGALADRLDRQQMIRPHRICVLRRRGTVQATRYLGIPKDRQSAAGTLVRAKK
jgi:MFS family permease